MLIAEAFLSGQDRLAFVVHVSELVTAFVMGVAKLGQLSPFLDAVLLTSLLLAREMLFAMRLLLVTRRCTPWVATDVSLAIGDVGRSRIGALGSLANEACETGPFVRLEVFV